MATVDAKPFFIQSIAETRNIETVKKAIKAKYGFDVTDEYARDLIQFVENMTNRKS